MMQLRKKKMILEHLVVGRLKAQQIVNQMATTEEDDLAGVQDASSEDEGYSYEDDMSESEMALPGNSSGRRGRFSRKRARADYIESLPLMEGEGKSLRILGFNQNQRATFLKTLMRFGFRDYDWREFVPRLKGKDFDEVHEYGFLFMRHIDEGINDSPTFSAEFFGSKPGAALFAEDVRECYPSLCGRIWKEEHDILLLKVILRHGYARWQAIVEDKDLGLAEVARQELSLPVISGPSAGGVQMGDSASNSFNEALDAAKGNQSNPDYSTLHQFREVQRRIVKFIRKISTAGEDSGFGIMLR